MIDSKTINPPGITATADNVDETAEQLIQRGKAAREQGMKSSWELAEIYAKLHRQHSMTIAKIAKRFGVQRSHVSRFIKTWDMWHDKDARDRVTKQLAEEARALGHAENGLPAFWDIYRVAVKGHDAQAKKEHDAEVTRRVEKANLKLAAERDKERQDQDEASDDHAEDLDEDHAEDQEQPERRQLPAYAPKLHEGNGSQSANGSPADGDQPDTGKPAADYYCPVTDLPLPAKLHDVFFGANTGQDQMEAESAELKSMMRRLKGAGSWNKWLPLEEIDVAIDNLVKTLEGATPYAVHEACGGKGCADCRTAGWLPLYRYEELEQEADILSEKPEPEQAVPASNGEVKE
jgi:hypothetical protein